jgi:hypothetical protein
MKSEEFQKIKDEYKRYKDLMAEEELLREELKTRVDTYANLSRLAFRLEVVEDDLFGINNDEDIYVSLADSNLFERIKSDTDKNLYFFYGIVREDLTQNKNNRWGDDYVIFVPRNSELSLFHKYYVMLWDLVDSRGSILVPLKEYEQFKKDNYVFDIGEDINIPYLDDESYNLMRHSDFDGTDNYGKAYSQLRYKLFEYYVHSETEQEAVKKLVLNHSYTKDHM